MAADPALNRAGRAERERERGRGAGRRRRTLKLLLACLLVGAAAGTLAALLTPGHRAARHGHPPPQMRHPQAVWAPPTAAPLGDAAAAALVTPRPELRPGNAAANAYVPTDAQLRAFYAARDSEGQTRLQFSPLFGRVTGRPGLAHPSTDDLVQWAAHKWGIPEEVLRAQVQLESAMRMDWLGDRATVPASVYSLYPSRARVPGTHDVFQSMGLAQIKWVPDGHIGAGTEPLRRLSTAFDLDLLAATLRYYYDGDCHWCGPGYGPGQDWASIGAWYSPAPWNNPGAKRYIGSIKHVLRGRLWE